MRVDVAHAPAAQFANGDEPVVVILVIDERAAAVAPPPASPPARTCSSGGGSTSSSYRHSAFPTSPEPPVVQGMPIMTAVAAPVTAERVVVAEDTDAMGESIQL